MAVKISKNIAKRIGKSITTVYALFLSWFSAYKSRVETDSGTIQSEADSKTIFQMLEDNDLYDNTKLLITGEGGIKTRTDGVNVYVPKAYDFSENNNDSTQTTEADQPYLGSFIAPNEFQCFKNVNGETRYFEHPQISFASDEAWSISIVLNWSSSSSTRDAILGDTAGQTAFRIKDTTNVFRIVGDNNAITGSTSTSTLIGKLSIISFVYNGSNTITIYKNGVLFDSLLITDSFTFSSILRGGSYYFSGLIKYTRIQSGAMTTDQITAEYTALRAMIPEIESVTIGTQEWATSNFEAVATPMGNVIQEMQDATASEKITNGDNEAGLANMSPSGRVTISQSNEQAQTGTYSLKVTQNGNPGGKYIYNVNLTEGKYYKISAWVYLPSGQSTTKISLGTSSSNFIFETTLLDQWVKLEGYIKADATWLTIFGNGQDGMYDFWYVDNISSKQLGWADSQDLYDGLIAQGESVQTALEAAGFWAYHNNDADNGAVYGKTYNGAGRDLLKSDIATKADWDYHIATEAEWTSLLANEEVTLKKEGTDYWNTTGGTNTTGFTAIGGASRNADGTFGTLKNYVAFWCGDSDKIVKIYHDGTAAEIVSANLDEGAYIRLVKD